jgi:predicted DNA-binding transcriptional regulator AlpA
MMIFPFKKKILIRNFMTESTSETTSQSSGPSSEFIEELARAIVAQTAPKVALNHELWDVEECAAYLKAKRRQFLERICCQPSFPKRIKMPTLNAKSREALWVAEEIIEWALAQKEK